jgi:hypothetical protein
MGSMSKFCRTTAPEKLSTEIQMKPRGGKRPGAGRPKGVPNKASIERQAQIEASGLTPLEFMLNVLRDDKRTFEERMDAAKAAAPYVHPRLSSAEVKSETTVRYVARMPTKAPDSTVWQQQHAPQPKTIQ